MKRFLLLALLAFLLSGCSGLIRPEQSLVTDFAALSADNTVGQTFVAKYDGLAGVYFYLAPAQSGAGSITLHLRLQPGSASDLAVSENSLAVDQIHDPAYYGFFIPSLGGSNQKYYYAVLELKGGGEVRVGRAAGGSYLNGALYQNDAPSGSQAAFQLIYSRRKAFFGLGLEGLSWIGLLAVAFFLFVLPGWGLFSFLWPGWGRISWPEKLALSAGLSLAVYPLLVLWTGLTGLPLGAFKRFNRPEWTHPGFREVLPHLLLIFVIALVFLTRFWAIRSLEGPMWGDSLEHAEITQLFLDHGGLFHSWLPYSLYQTLTVQFGFPLFSALLAWLMGLTSIRATLLAGQIINAISVLAIYPLAVRLAKGNRWAGLTALLVAGLLSLMPAFYVNWGRFAQMGGQAILPVALWLVWEALSVPITIKSISKRPQWTGMVFSAIALAGMALTYYRMAFVYVSFILALLIAWGFSQWRFNARLWLLRLVSLVVIGLGAVFLFLPWLPGLWGSNLAGFMVAGVQVGSTLQKVQAEYTVWKDIFYYISRPLVAASLIGLGWSIFRRNWMIAAMGLWVLFLAAINAGRLVHLPGSNMIQTFAILIGLYLPASCILGWMGAEVVGSGNSIWRTALVSVAIIAGAIWGVRDQLHLAQPPTYAMITRPDVRAMDWINASLPEKDARFLVEGFTITNNTSFVGTDAGWWLPLFTHQQNTIPPQYALLSEAPVQPDYNIRMLHLITGLSSAGLNSPEGISLLCREKITHVYIGQEQGKVGFGSVQLFGPEELDGNPAYELLYHQDEVYIFALKPGACP